MPRRAARPAPPPPPPAVLHVVPEWAARRDAEALLYLEALVETRLPQRLRRTARALVSPNPFRDAPSLALGFVFAAALPELGFAYFWAVVRGALLLAAVQRLLPVRPPAAYAGRRLSDARRRGAAALRPAGALCADAYLALLLALPVAAALPPAAGAALVAALALAVCALRLLNGSHFHYQVALGLFLGCMVVYASPWLAARLPRLSRKQNVLGVAFVALPLLAAGALAAESNAAWGGFNVPRREFRDVLTGIAAAPPAVATGDARRRDSFYHLASSLERRAMSEVSETDL